MNNANEVFCWLAMKLQRRFNVKPFGSNEEMSGFIAKNWAFLGNKECILVSINEDGVLISLQNEDGKAIHHNLRATILKEYEDFFQSGTDGRFTITIFEASIKEIDLEALVQKVVTAYNRILI